MDNMLFKKINRSEYLIEDYKFDAFSSIRIRAHNNIEVLLEFNDFYGEITLNDLEQIITKS